jgi:Protein of unknown function (DUF2510)
MTDQEVKTPAGWYPDPEQVETQRYWDGEKWTDQRAPLAKPGGGIGISPQSLRRLGASVAVLLAILYFSGRLDHALYPAGLNFNECGKNGFGSVYCGDELTEYRDTVEQPFNAAQEELFGP